MALPTQASAAALNFMKTGNYGIHNADLLQCYDLLLFQLLECARFMLNVNVFMQKSWVYSTELLSFTTVIKSVRQSVCTNVILHVSVLSIIAVEEDAVSCQNTSATAK